MVNHKKLFVCAVMVLAAFFFGRSTGIDSCKAERTDEAEQVVETRNEAEKVIVQERVVYRDRIQKIREVVHQCNIPADLIGLLRESRVFTGG